MLVFCRLSLSVDLSDVFSWVDRLRIWGKTSEMKCPRHLSAHGINITQWCHEPGSLGKEALCQVSPLTVTIFYFPHIPSSRESFLLLPLFFWHHLAACGILVPRADYHWQLADHWISQLRGCTWVLWRRRDELLASSPGGSNVFLNLNKLKPVSFHPQTPAPGGGIHPRRLLGFVCL